MAKKSGLSTQVPKTEEFDLVVLGSGTGSKVAAWTTAEQGKRVALIERKYIGGSCHNIACLPSKNIIHSAKVASYVRRSREFGIILGFAGFAVDAGETMGSVQIAIIAGLPYTALRDAILTHPTLAEGLNFLFASVPYEPSQAMRTNDRGRVTDERLKKLA